MQGTQQIERNRTAQRVRNDQHEVKLDRRKNERARQDARSTQRNQKYSAE